MEAHEDEMECTVFDEGAPVDVSENIFADLGLPDAEEYNAKAQLALTIRRVIQARGIKQKEAALQARIKQSDVSKIINGHLDGIGLERLTNVLNNLDQDVEIHVRPKRTRLARTYVSSGEADSVMPFAAAGRRD